MAVATCCLTREAVTTAKVTAEYKQLMKDMVIDHRREREKVTKSSSPPSVRPFQEDFLGPRSHRASAIVPTAKRCITALYFPLFHAREKSITCRMAHAGPDCAAGLLLVQHRSA